MVDALSVAESVLGFSDVEVAAGVVKASKAVGRLHGLFGADRKFLVVFDVAGDETIGEIVVDMLGVGAYAAYVALDEDAEDACPVAPLAYPTVAVLKLVATPSEEFTAS